MANLSAVDAVEQWMARTAVSHLSAWVEQWEQSGDAAWLAPLSLSLPHGRTRPSIRTVSGRAAWDARVRRAKRGD